MKVLCWMFVAVLAGTFSTTLQAAEGHGVYELRSIKCAEGKQGDTLKFLKEAAVKLLAKHHIDVIGIWVPVDAKDERIFTLIGHKDLKTGVANWKAFDEDADWNAAKASLGDAGEIIDEMHEYYLTKNDYSPEISMEPAGERVFELRTYIATPGNLAALNNRFKNHTMELFKKHGMTNIAYFSVSEKDECTCTNLLKSVAKPGDEKADVPEEEKAHGRALVYFISHKSPEAAKESFGKFRVDEDWKKALGDSEKAAGGPLTVKMGVKSLFLKSVDFSPLK